MSQQTTSFIVIAMKNILEESGFWSYAVKDVVFWGMMPCGLVRRTEVSKEHVASIFRVKRLWGFPSHSETSIHLTRATESCIRGDSILHCYHHEKYPKRLQSLILHSDPVDHF
jgi:hypothetical protein